MNGCILLFCLSQVYIEGGVGYVEKPHAIPQWAIEKFGLDTQWKYDSNHVANPRGKLAIGHQWELSSRTTVDISLRHESWIGTTADYGQNSVFLSVRSFPFKH